MSTAPHTKGSSYARTMACQDVVVGRPRDGDDRVAWLLDHKRFTHALRVVESDPTLRPATLNEVRQLFAGLIPRFGQQSAGLPRSCQRCMLRVVAEAAWHTVAHATAQHVASLLPEVPLDTGHQVAQRYLEHLLGERQYAAAAALTPRLLRKDAAAWERWVYLFAQLRQLKELAPFIPVAEPTLRNTAYEMASTHLSLCIG